MWLMLCKDLYTTTQTREGGGDTSTTAGHIFLAITMDNLECIVIWIRIRTDNRRENWSRMPMNDGLDSITKLAAS